MIKWESFGKNLSFFHFQRSSLGRPFTAIQTHSAWARHFSSLLETSFSRTHGGWKIMKDRLCYYSPKTNARRVWARGSGWEWGAVLRVAFVHRAHLSRPEVRPFILGALDRAKQRLYQDRAMWDYFWGKPYALLYNLRHDGHCSTGLCSLTDGQNLVDSNGCLWHLPILSSCRLLSVQVLLISYYRQCSKRPQSNAHMQNRDKN